MTVENGAMISLPTRLDRFWRALGFRYHLGEEPEGGDLLPGWSHTTLGFRFGWPDRLRLLLSGRLQVTSILHTDTPSPKVAKSRVDWRIFAPGERL